MSRPTGRSKFILDDWRAPDVWWPPVPEVMVDGDRWAVVADRIQPETILAAERVPEWLA